MLVAFIIIYVLACWHHLADVAREADGQQQNQVVKTRFCYILGTNILETNYQAPEPLRPVSLESLFGCWQIQVNDYGLVI